jgi:hypothetical protein
MSKYKICFVTLLITTTEMRRVHPVWRMSCIPLWGSFWTIVSKMIFGLTVSLSLIWLSSLVSRNMLNFSRVSINLPLLVKCIMPSMGPMSCTFSSRCWAKLDFPFPCLKSRRCSWERVLKNIPVCPVYFMLHVGQVSWYIPEFSYLSLRG